MISKKIRKIISIIAIPTITIVGIGNFSAAIVTKATNNVEVASATDTPTSIVNNDIVQLVKDADGNFVDNQGVCYNLSDDHGTATVVKNKNDEKSNQNAKFSSVDIKIPQKVTFDGIQYTVNEIGEHCFSLSSIENIELPNTLNYIDDFAFFACEKLKKIDLPQSLNSIKTSAFSNCKSLKEVIVPNKTSIGMGAFGQCDNLQKAIIGDEKVFIKIDEIFKSCPNLKYVIVGDKTNKSSIDTDTLYTEIKRIETLNGYGITSDNNYTDQKNIIDLSNIEGKISLTVYKKENSSEQIPFVVQIDRTQPQMSFSLKTYNGQKTYNGEIINDNVVVSVKQENINNSGVSYYYSSDNMNWTKIENNSFSLDKTGRYKIKAISGSGVETLGNEFNVNIENPIASPLNVDTGDYKENTWSDKDINITLTGGIEDKLMIKEYQYSINGENWFSLADNNLVIKEGVNKYYFRVVSNGGMILSQTKGITIKVDKISPKIEINGYDRVDINKNVNITVNNINDNISPIKYQYKKDSGEWQEYNNCLIIEPPCTGTITFKATSETGLEDVKTINIDIQKYYMVTFKDSEGKTIEIKTVQAASSTVAPEAPVKDGYIFKGWDKNFNNITEDLEITPLYEKVEQTPIAPSPTGDAASIPAVVTIITGTIGAIITRRKK